MNKELTKLKSELEAGRPVISFTSGTSMEPLLHDKRKKNATHVLIVPVEGRCRVGDMLLALMKDERYILHRIIRVDDKDGKVFYQTRGDNCIGCEYISQEVALGVVSEIYTKKKTIRVTDKNYKRYVKFWMKTYPIRKIFMKCKIYAAKVKRRVEKMFS